MNLVENFFNRQKLIHLPGVEVSHNCVVDVVLQAKKIIVKSAVIINPR